MHIIKWYIFVSVALATLTVCIALVPKVSVANYCIAKLEH